MLHSFGKYWFNITETFKILTQFTIYYQKNHIYLNNINSDHIQKFFKNLDSCQSHSGDTSFPKF